MWGSQDKWHRELDRWLTLLNDKRLWNGVRQLFAYTDGPNVQVYDEGQYARVLIRPPAFPPGVDWRWSVRPTGNYLMVRGTFAGQEQLPGVSGRRESREDERFARIVPLPFPVRKRPSLTRYEGQVLSMRFAKLRSRQKKPDGWYRVPPRDA